MTNSETRLSPKTGKPINTKASNYGKKLKVSTRIALKHSLRENCKITNKKPCFLKHMKTETIIQFDCVFDICRFLNIKEHSSSKGIMIKRGYHKEWYFVYGTHLDPNIVYPQEIGEKAK